MTKRSIKHLSLTLGFLAGLWWVGVFRLLATLKPTPELPTATNQTLAPNLYFTSPEAVLAALTNENVDARRAVWQQLRLTPSASTAFYDFARDLNYPERADRARLRYVNFDSDPAPEALITFVHLEYPVALVLHREPVGWAVAGTFSAWLRYEQYPYDDWLATPETVAPGRHELLLRESAGDATRYVRTLHLWRLEGRAFREIGVFEEESLVPPFAAKDMALERKVRCVGRLEIAPGRLAVAGACALVQFSGVAPTHSYRSEIDEALHVAEGHWRERPRQRLRAMDNYRMNFTWDEAQGRFAGGPHADNLRLWER